MELFGTFFGCAERYLDFCHVVVLSLPCRSTPHSSPSQTPVRRSSSASGRAGGGRGRNPDVLMEIQLSKVQILLRLSLKSHRSIQNKTVVFNLGVETPLGEAWISNGEMIRQFQFT